MVFLVTGFEPFGGEPTNPSALLAAALADRGPRGCRVRSAVLPVSNARLRPALEEALDAAGDDLAAVIALGQTSAGEALLVERVFLNLRDYAAPDEDGEHLVDAPIVEGGPHLYASTLPTRGMVAASLAVGVPAALSRDAGAFLCNQLGYVLRHTLAERGRRDVLAGFVHVPMLPEQVARRVAEGTDRRPRGSMSLETSLAGIGAMLAAVASERHGRGEGGKGRNGGAALFSD